MPAWISVYCRRRLNGITPADIQAELDRADLRTLAESYDLDEGLVDVALPFLRVERVGPDRLRVAYRDPAQRQVEVHRWTAADRVAEELAELEVGGELRARLAGTIEVVGIELGWSQTDDLGLVLGYEVARFLAARGDGIVRGDDDAWSVIDRGAFRRLQA